MKKGGKLLVVEPGALFREGLRHILEEAGYDLVWCSDTLPDVYPDADEPTNPATLILGGMVGRRVAADIDEARQRYPNMRILRLVDPGAPGAFGEPFEEIIDSVLPKDCSCQTMVNALSLLKHGFTVIPCNLLSVAFVIGADDIPREVDKEAHTNTAPRSAELSTREINVLHRLVLGLSNKEISRQLGISEATVKVHIKSILRKTEVRNRTQAAMWAVQQGLADRHAGDPRHQPNNPADAV